MRRGCSKPVINEKRKKDSEGKRMSELKPNAELSCNVSERKKQGKMNSYADRDNKSFPKKKSKKEPNVINWPARGRKSKTANVSNRNVETNKRERSYKGKNRKNGEKKLILRSVASRRNKTGPDAKNKERLRKKE